MKLQDYVDTLKLQSAIEDGYISVRHHPTLPIRILNYGASAQFEGYWPHEVCACRGLIVDGDDNILARPQYKFFNLGQSSTILEYDDTTHTVLPMDDVMVDSGHILRLASSCGGMTISRKMDGQMGVLWNYGDQWGVATRGSFESEGATFATQKFQKFVKYGAVEFIPKGWTLIFEIIAKHLRIVIPYQWEGLCLLTAVNNETGEEMNPQNLYQLWMNINQYARTVEEKDAGIQVPARPWCRLVEFFDIQLQEAVNDPSMEEEGYVVAVNRPKLPPVKAKIKLAEYKRLHKILCNVTPQMIWKELAKPMETWLAVDSKYNHDTGETTHSISVPPDFANWVKQWQRGMTKAFHEKLVLAIKAQDELRQRDAWETDQFKHDFERKQWLLSSNGGGYPSEIASAAIFLKNGNVTEAHELLWNQVRPHGRDDHYYVEGNGE